MVAPVVVIGGGIVGLCTAYSLALRGVDVCVIDRRTDAPSASWGNAGWIVPALSAPVPAPGVVGYGLRALARRSPALRIRPRPDPRLARWLWDFARHCNTTDHRAGLLATLGLATETPARFDDLARSGVEFDMWSQGLTFVALDRSVAEAGLESLRPLAEHGYHLPDRVLSGDELRATEPAMSDAVMAGYHVGDERHVDPRSLLAGLRRWLVAHGVQLLVGEPVRGFVMAGQRVTGVTVGRQTVPAASVVLAAGAWTGRLAARLGCRLPLQGGKGYSFTAAKTHLGRPLYLLEAKTAATPLGTHTRIAGTMELGGLDPRVSARRIEAIRTAASAYLGGLDEAAVAEPWAGLRPMVPDGRPVIGLLPPTTNAYVNTGHAMLGVTLAPASGERLATLILTGETHPSLLPLGPERFDRRHRMSGRSATTPRT